ncbi:hypothetical protein AXF42_Ash001109 [Apostasia shenzhenica]|uniref:Borealin N-terminal domain-containing protein n=1 Tax=Apostasia shenzhenica TaxID=1088818 RepID=A0A2I0AU28_9ASPA|nr:hypothetical protein AXF42_Ash001109 [Apostasia shenzhenica]
MPRAGRKRKTGAKSSANPLATTSDAENAAQQFCDRQIAFNHREVERRIAAIRAIQEAEVQTMLSCLRVLRSYLSKEQLEMPALKFFREYLPNLTVVKNKEHKIFELKPKEGMCGGNGRPSIVSSGSCLRFSAESVKHSFLQASNFQIPDFQALDTHVSQALGARDAFKTPGGVRNRLSFGVTPKTSRLPKQGEVLLSVHGSPLGVYKEDNLEAIHESADGLHSSGSQGQK